MAVVVGGFVAVALAGQKVMPDSVHVGVAQWRNPPPPPNWPPMYPSPFIFTVLNEGNTIVDQYGDHWNWNAEKGAYVRITIQNGLIVEDYWYFNPDGTYVQVFTRFGSMEGGVYS
jgi:hypothetical protein